MGQAARRKKPGASRLKAYREKRDFSRTGEPRPRIAKAGGWRFVVQKHAARRLHFDLRLELNGVLKSWAVAKGPSMTPGVKRLAVHTEDHPMEYLEWEGVIPKGEYGGGTMIVWDRGTWEPADDPVRGLEKGHIQFALKGRRLKGRFDLVRMARRSGEKKDSWLLIKRTDEHALTPGDVEPVDRQMSSVISGKTNERLAQASTTRPDHAAREKIKRRRDFKLPELSRIDGVKKGILPVFIEPSLAALASHPPSGRNWLHEIKFDGYRMQARIDGGRIKLLTRKGLDWTSRFPTISQSMKQFPLSSGLVDGEIIVQDETGVSSFSGLQSDLRAGRKDRLVYMVFDLLYCEGFNLTGASLEKRKELLQAVCAELPLSSPVRYSEHIEAGGEKLLQSACRMGLEGIVSKQAMRPYVSGRGEHWLKSKCVLRQEFIIVGYVPSATLRTAVGSLVLAYYDGEELVHAGRAGTGFSNDMAVELRKALDKLPGSPPRFKNKITVESAKGVKWAKPALIAEVEYRGWSSDNLLRQSSFKGIREDKQPHDIRLESAISRKSRPQSSPVETMRLTHPERVLWEDAGITKQGLADFYAGIADWILPHIASRVLSLLRCPSGAGGKCFYAKHAWEGLDKALKPIDVGEGKPMLALTDVRGLIALVQSSVLEIHPWGSRIDELERPDRIIFDLDPGIDLGWEAVVAAAQEVRERLGALKLASFVKTSGGKGLHVVVPLVPALGWEEAKRFSQSVAEGMAGDSPAKFVATMTKRRRAGRIFVDYLRNSRGATAVAPYSTRAREGAPVSVPLTWEELATGVRPNQFTLDNLRQRLDFLKKDPWDGFWTVKQRLPSK